MAQTIASAIDNVNSARFGSARYSSSVDIKEARLNRLKELLDLHGGNKAALARTLGRSPAQVSQWFYGVRTITEETARDIETRARRPKGWLDGEVFQEQFSIVSEALNSLEPEAQHELIEYLAYKVDRTGAHSISEKLRAYGAGLLGSDEPDK